MPSTLEIDLTSRWDAVTLLHRLATCHAHLVQLGARDGRWLVRAVTPGTHGEGIPQALELVEEWHHERGLGSVWVSLYASPVLTDEDLRELRSRRRARVAAHVS